MALAAPSAVGSSLWGFAASGVLNAMGGWMTEGAQWLLGEVATQLSAASQPQLGAEWFLRNYAVMLYLSAVIVLPLLLAACIQSVLRQDFSELVRTLTVRLPVAFLLGAVAVQLVRLLVSATDAMSETVEKASGFGPRLLLHTFGGGFAASAAAPGMVGVSLGILVATFTLLLWFELVVRSSAIVAATLFVPLVLAALVWPATVGWARRLAETLLAAVLSKFVIVVVLVAGTASLSSADHAGGLQALVQGAALVLIASISPFTLLRLVPFVEAGAVGHLEGLGRRALRTMPRAWALASDYSYDDPPLPGEPAPEWVPPLAETGPLPEYFKRFLADRGVPEPPSGGSSSRSPGDERSHELPGGGKDVGK